MKIVGIVAEYNPLHNGHLYHIEQAKKDADVLIVVMGGNYSMRGGVAPMDKFIKTSLVLKYGVDLVVELPTVYAIQSADIFAAAAVSILNELHCTDIYFGSESDDIEYLNKVQSLTEKKSYSELLHEFMGQGFSYPKASGMALESLGIPTLESCDRMNICYLKALKDLKSLIVPHTVKRESKYASATSIRMFGPTIDMVPEEIMEYYRNYGFNHMNNYYDLLRYKIILLPLPAEEARSGRRERPGWTVCLYRCSGSGARTVRGQEPQGLSPPGTRPFSGARRRQSHRRGRS